jgi:hypothetical protein
VLLPLLPVLLLLPLLFQVLLPVLLLLFHAVPFLLLLQVLLPVLLMLFHVVPFLLLLCHCLPDDVLLTFPGAVWLGLNAGLGEAALIAELDCAALLPLALLLLLLLLLAYFWDAWLLAFHASAPPPAVSIAGFAVLFAETFEPDGCFFEDQLLPFQLVELDPL